ncbi:unnamed protein product [Rotaria sp. Silwood2]|nr:unnamed protein product [Rotaria sp. Silwood2]
MIYLKSFEQFNVYNTNNDRLLINDHQLMYDCLHYYVNEDILKYQRANYILVHQIIVYCFRPLEKIQNDLLNASNTRDRNFTFDQLRMKNVSSYQLYQWSAPIDLAENYEIYLNGNDSLSESVFYNCSQPWFGPLCKYSFDFNNVTLSFDAVVKKIFQQKKDKSYLSLGENVIFTNLSCYIYLQCNRGGLFCACLDWREICNGKIDCINGGIDEAYCDQLEINECKENEYRCHNGQCIPEVFLRDDLINRECLDGTDEPALPDYPKSCSFDPAFRCEDITCRPGIVKDFACGDGECTLTTCTNKRDVLFKKEMIEMTSNISNQCRDIMVCISGLNKCETELDREEHCPELFQFPEVSILYGHVQFIYGNNESDIPVVDILYPKYICYNAQLCSFPSTFQFKNYSPCRYIFDWEINIFYVDSWSRLILHFKKIFHTCSTTIKEYCQHHLYKCNSTENKCISKHRLIDEIQDCYMNDDEQYNKSCSLTNGKHRFPCKNKCFSPILVRIDNGVCLEGEYSPDLIQQNRRLYFQTVCDGVIDLLLFLILINGQKHMDETECDMWQCNNSYTRCDGNWNCFNGADEVNCPPSKCGLFEHMCVSPLNNSLICLPIEKAGDGNVDCLGALDERQLCRRQHPHLNAIRFWCSKSTSCKMLIDLCSGRKECLYGDDEQFCTSGCSRCSNLYRNQTEVENFLCTLTDVGKKKFVPLSLSDSRIYPVELKSANIKQDFVPVDGSLVVEKKIELVQRNINLTSIWRCNRGLNIRVWLRETKMKKSKVRFNGEHTEILATGYLEILYNST